MKQYTDTATFVIVETDVLLFTTKKWNRCQ